MLGKMDTYYIRDSTIAKLAWPRYFTPPSCIHYNATPESKKEIARDIALLCRQKVTVKCVP